jgi:ABC-type nitrate/sulfonate/bicarbonate transport system substrate-binding protein
MKKRIVGALCIVGAVGLAIAGCSSSGSKASGGGGGGGGGSASNAGGKLTPVTVAFTFSWKSEYAPLVLADQKGIFAKHGLKVTFKEGKGSQVAFSSLGNATDTFVIGPTCDAALAIANGVPIESVATFIPVTPSILVAKEGTDISTPQKLVGKHVGLRSGADASLFFDSFLRKNNVDPSKVQVTDLNSAAATTSFIKGNVQVVDAFANNELPLIESQFKTKVNTLAFADFGFPLLGQGVTVSTAMAKSQGDVIRRFLAAETEGIQAAKADPVGAAKAIKSAEGPKLPDEPVVEQQVKATLAAMTPETGEPAGRISDKTWANLLQLFKDAGQNKKNVPASKFYTNDFLAS